MKYCRFELAGQAHYGLVESVGGQDEITRVLVTPPESVGGDMEDLRTKRMDHLALAHAKLLPPVVPTKIVCVGRNYREHAEELGNEVPTEPLLFFKPPSCLLASGHTIRIPKVSERVDYEGEIGVVIGKLCYKLDKNDDARPFILGYTCVNDVTARDLQNKDDQWARAKGFDTFCPVGPLVVDEVDPWSGMTLETRVNDEVRQQGTTKDFIFPLGDVIRYISQIMTLMPGDLIATGTPKGVGPLQAADKVEVTVQGVGTLTNSVANDE
jgi:2-keto-4-pentenoate hydratase/2-oxohepta-3-ene-1,7-dioic acid hydratase in catechol pathway